MLGMLQAIEKIETVDAAIELERQQRTKSREQLARERVLRMRIESRVVDRANLGARGEEARQRHRVRARTVHVDQGVDENGWHDHRTGRPQHIAANAAGTGGEGDHDHPEVRQDDRHRDDHEKREQRRDRKSVV